MIFIKEGSKIAKLIIDRLEKIDFLTLFSRIFYSNFFFLFSQVLYKEVVEHETRRDSGFICFNYVTFKIKLKLISSYI